MPRTCFDRDENKQVNLAVLFINIVQKIYLSFDFLCRDLKNPYSESVEMMVTLS